MHSMSCQNITQKLSRYPCNTKILSSVDNIVQHTLLQLFSVVGCHATDSVMLDSFRVKQMVISKAHYKHD